MTPSYRHSQPDVSGAVRSLLASRGLSLAEIARQSRLHFPRSRLFRIPPNFYDALRHPSFSPSLHQLFALSVLTGYRFSDWLHLSGFSFDDASGLQPLWPRYQTTELDARVYDSGATVAWCKEAGPVFFGTALTPLSRWLSGKVILPLDSLSSKIDPTFRYFKIGSRDAYAFPDLLPGSIVRVDRRVPAEPFVDREYSEQILAIEHSRGVVCSRLRSTGRGRVVLCSRQLPYAPIEFTLGAEARILGSVDMEIRRLASPETPVVSPAAGRLWKPGTLKTDAFTGRVGEWLRSARLQSGLSFREASVRTGAVARMLGHPNYFCAASTLSDLEARDIFPRHIHKLISLSAVYSLSMAELARRGGLRLEETGQEAMPDRWKYSGRLRLRNPSLRPSRFLKAVEGECEEIPFFLRQVLPSALGLANLSIRDFFWAGFTGNFKHPYLKNSVFLVVNRKSKTPVASLSSPVWAQPLYVLELRDGSRLCAACSLQNGTLVVRPCATAAGNLLRLRNRDDAEVVGRVVAVARRLDSPNRAAAI